MGVFWTICMQAKQRFKSQDILSADGYMHGTTGEVAQESTNRNQKFNCYDSSNSNLDSSLSSGSGSIGKNC